MIHVFQITVIDPADDRAEDRLRHLVRKTDTREYRNTDTIRRLFNQVSADKHASDFDSSDLVHYNVRTVAAGRFYHLRKHARTYTRTHTHNATQRQRTPV